MSDQALKRTLEIDCYSREVSYRGGKSGLLSAAGEVNVVCMDVTSDNKQSQIYFVFMNKLIYE